jgi:purine-binding chemotaxis protein CheW
MSELIKHTPSIQEDKRLELKENQVPESEQYLTFMMADDEYGIDILSVQEIHGWFEARPIPNTPNYLKGVIDWRGTIVPVVDLRMRFEYNNVTYTKTTVVIILKTEIESFNDSVTVGIVVDAVSDVYDITTENLRAVPRLGNKVDTQYIKAIAKVENKMIVLLELAKLINLEDLTKD